MEMTISKHLLVMAALVAATVDPRSINRNITDCDRRTGAGILFTDQ